MVVTMHDHRSGVKIGGKRDRASRGDPLQTLEVIELPPYRRRP
jgi:hypothetical protein